jgi:CBS domain-containing protein
MLLNTICTVDVVCCARATTVAAAAKLMRDHHIGDLVVVDSPDQDRTAVGVVTDRDLVVEVLAKGMDPVHTTVGAIMRTPVVVARDTEDTTAALERMQAQGVRRIPVVDERERVVGVVTLDDLLKVHAAHAAAMVEIISKEQSKEHRTRR